MPNPATNHYKEYKVHRENVIDLFNGYKKHRKKANDGVDIEHLEDRINKLKQGKFTLAVAGEVKAGKSTFINALLEAEILPSDVLQSSNAIVEIFKSENSYLKIKYADGKDETVYDDLDTPDIDEARERLHQICSIHDKYRELPTTLIDDEIKKTDKTLEVADDLIDSWEKNSKFDNLRDKKELIEEYIKCHPKEKIPVEISFGYPLKWDFDELRIVDSPGVNGVGGVGNVAFNYLESANAILFIKDRKPVESAPVREFVDKTITNRSKESLFLVLTHTGLDSEEEADRLYSEAKRLYASLIPEERILAVDSICELIKIKLNSGESCKDIRKDEKKKRIVSILRDKAEDEEIGIRQAAEEVSRFNHTREAIENFAAEAPNLQLSEILDKIRAGYEQQEALEKDKLNRLAEKKKDTQLFEAEIERIQNSLTEYENLSYSTAEMIIRNFTGDSAEPRKLFEKIKKGFSEQINKSTSNKEVRKIFYDGTDEIKQKADEIVKSVSEKLDSELQKANKGFKNKHDITLPKADLDAIENKAKKDSYKTVDVYKKRPWDWLDIAGSGLPRWFRDNKIKVGEEEQLDIKKYREKVRAKVKKRWDHLCKAIDHDLKKSVHSQIEDFKSQMASTIEERKKALENEKTKKETNEDIIKNIQKLEHKKKERQKQMKRVKALLENLQP